MEPLSIATALYDYEARTEDEIGLTEGVSVQVYENNDPDWWFVKIGTSVGLAPVTYLNNVSLLLS